MRTGDFISTAFGQAELILYREDRVYVLRLPFGMLYANEDTIRKMKQQREDEEAAAKRAENVAVLNQAYEAVEKMRRFNLEVACDERGIYDVDFEVCAACLLDGSAAARPATVAGKVTDFFRPKSSAISSSMPRLKRFVEGRENHRKPPSCLTCGSPACWRHSSEVFRREGITVCHKCESVFQMDFIVDCMTLEGKERQAKVDQLIDLYDRAVLLLKFSSQYIDEVVEGLQESKKRNNKINIGGSSVGIVSGVLGVVAAATILTPAGAPLLIVSLMLGTGATAVQTGTDVSSKYFSEPNKIADRIMATHGMLLSVLAVTGTLRDAATRDHIRTDAFNENSQIFQELTKEHIENRQALLAGMTAGRFSLATAEFMGVTEGAAIARSVRTMSRSGTAAMRTLRFARVAGGALAAATLLLEAKCMHSTVQSIKAGSPCEKAEALRSIKAELPNLPTTQNLDRECGAYIRYMEQRGQQMKEEEAIQLLLEVSTVGEKTKCGEHILEEGEDSQTEFSSSPTMKGTGSVASSKLSGSLWERIQRYKQHSEEQTKQSFGRDDDRIEEEEAEASPPKDVVFKERKKKIDDDDDWTVMSGITTGSSSLIE